MNVWHRSVPPPGSIPYDRASVRRSNDPHGSAESVVTHGPPVCGALVRGECVDRDSLTANDRSSRSATRQGNRTDRMAVPSGVERLAVLDTTRDRLAASVSWTRFWGPG